MLVRGVEKRALGPVSARLPQKRMLRYPERRFLLLSVVAGKLEVSACMHRALH